MWNNLNKKRAIVFGILIISIIALTVTITYAYFLATLEETQNEVVKVQAGTMSLTFSDNSDEINNIERTLNFGDTVEKEFRIENTGTLDAYAKISWDDLTNTFLDGSLTYRLEYKTSETGTYQAIMTRNNKVPTSSSGSKQLIVDYLEIPAGVTYVYKITITYNDLDVDQTSDLNAVFATKFALNEGSGPITSDAVIKSLNLKVNPNQSKSIPNFANVATTDETKDGLFSMEDDYGTSYYYRGAVENNYVKFGKNKDGQDMYWRIIRFNGDGSARLIYDGTQAYANGIADDARYAITRQPWNANYNDAKYVGWMFGGADGVASTSKEEAQRNETDSDIKEKVDEWYLLNIKNTNYSKYLSDEIFCNDRTLNSGSGYGFSTMQYGGAYRLVTTKSPSFKCLQQNDRFTLRDDSSLEVIRVENSVKGNNALTYPVGLITADEISTAGGFYAGVNTSYYLYKSSNFYGLSFTPKTVGENGYTNGFALYNNNGWLGTVDVSYVKSAAAPVINVAAEYAINLSGEGTKNFPYYLSID